MSTYDADYTKRFYNAYGRHEWDRLEDYTKRFYNAYGRHEWDRLEVQPTGAYRR